MGWLGIGEGVSEDEDEGGVEMEERSQAQPCRWRLRATKRMPTERERAGRQGFFLIGFELNRSLF
jgi:hypothetical protein